MDSFIMSCTSTGIRKPRHNKYGVGPTQKLMDTHGLSVKMWGWAQNEVNLYVLLENGFPDTSEIHNFIKNCVIIHLAVQDKYTDLLKKVHKCGFQDTCMIMAGQVLIICFLYFI